MKFVIDTEECKKLDVPLSLMLQMIAIYFESDINRYSRDILLKTGYIEHEGYDTLHQLMRPKLTQQGVDLVESLILNGEFNTPKYKDRFENLAEKLRELYPKGKKPGTSYMWKDSNAIIAKRLKMIVKKYGDCFTDEQAINATKKYVESFNGNYQYMQLLKYFIHKIVIKDGQAEESSQLLSYIENESTEINTSFDEMRYD